MAHLTIEDLLFLEVKPMQAMEWLSYWEYQIPDEAELVCMSKFGDLFLRMPNGHTLEFSLVGGGTTKTVAETPDEFVALVAAPDWREIHLRASLIEKLHDDGLIPDKDQCYGFAPHPAISGKVEQRHVMIVDVSKWHSLCAALFQALATGKRPRQ